MAWRVALFVGVVAAVLLMAGSVWAGTVTRTVATRCVKRVATGDLWQKTYGCALYSDGGTIKAHAVAERNLRYAAGGVFVVTLASLPMLGAGRRERSGEPRRIGGG